MKSPRLYVGLTFVTVALIAACANSPREASPTSTDKTSRAASAVGASKYVLVDFAPGQTQLSAAAKTSIRRLTAEAPENAVDEIKVLAWADKEYPANGTKPTRSDIALADDRADSVKNFIREDLNYDVDVDNHNMAKRPSTLAQVMTTDDYGIKSTFEHTGQIAVNPTSRDQIFVGKKASKALVLVKFEK